MGGLNTEISVSSSLDGKDLWLIESFIKNKHTMKNLNLIYNENNPKCDVFIAKELVGGKFKYFATLKNSDTSLPILPYLNPMTLKRLFLYLGSATSIERYKLNKTYRDISNYQIYKFLDSSTHNILHITHKEFHLILDNFKNLAYCSVKIDEKFMMKLKNTPIGALKIGSSEKSINVNDHYYSIDLKALKWNMGLLLHEDFFDKSRQINNFSFKQINWPDYGNLPFKKEFIQLSALLDNKSISYDNLVKKFQIGMVNRFLNALYLTKNIDLIPYEQQIRNDNSLPEVKHSKFLTSLKLFINKIHF